MDEYRFRQSDNYKLDSEPIRESPRKTPSKRGRKPAKVDVKAKLERSRQSARECRARKKLRYQYLEELVSSRERAIIQLRDELERYKLWVKQMDKDCVPKEVFQMLERHNRTQIDNSDTVCL
ncbi:DgyrCDS7019 [Dimorphilus gyrociliatus]|uniref:DgyrCDS7019 n=1 Tax=Dimorphilus gyrociliatus TaxID=2664684 RepID=A0A7I8VPR1_9ANNE|nr:DgyrCDS7019 [Dimorphilus gyrociliatus]